MTKTIDTLVEDIYGLFTTSRVNIPDSETASLGTRLGDVIKRRLQEVRGDPYLRLSNLGTRCNRQLWYKLNKPDLSEPMGGPAQLKFLIGDLWETIIIFLARIAGHDVRDEQREVDLFGVRGHIDGTIDGVTVDVKSASTQSFKKFTDHLGTENDDFGYLTQLGAYQATTGTTEAAFLAADKTLGKLHLDKHTQLQNIDYEKLVQEKLKVINAKELPERGYTDVPEGKSGNRKLGTQCKYCSFKHACWPELRTYIYSSGPVFLTHVEKNPEFPNSLQKSLSNGTQEKGINQLSCPMEEYSEKVWAN